MCTGGAVCVVLMLNGCTAYGRSLCRRHRGHAGRTHGTGMFHTCMGIPPILAGILTQLALYSINLRILGSALTRRISVRKYNLLPVAHVTSRGRCWVSALLVLSLRRCIVLMYWFVRHGAGLLAARHRQQRSTWRARRASTPTLRKRAGPDAVQRHRGARQRAATPSIRASPTSTWAAARSSSVWPRSSSARSIFGKIFRNFATQAAGALRWARCMYYVVIQVVLWLGLNTDDLKLLTALVVWRCSCPSRT